MKRMLGCGLVVLVPRLLLAGGGIEEEMMRQAGKFLDRLPAEQRQALYSKANEAIQQMQKKQQERAAKNRKQRASMSLNLVKELFKKAETAYKEGDLPAAYSYYLTVANADVKGAEQTRQKALEKLRELEAEALARYDEADVRFRKGEYVESARLLCSISDEFPYTSVTEKARRMLRTLTAKPGAAAAVEYARGLQHENAEDYVRAVAIYQEVVAKYPNELDGKRAGIRLEKLRSDPAVLEVLQRAKQFEASAEAPKLLNIARNYLLNEQTERAAEQLEIIVKRFPDTTEGKEAQDLLNAIRSPAQES